MKHWYSRLGIPIQSASGEATFKTAFGEGAKTIAPTIPATAIWAVVTAVAMIAAGMPAFYVILINLTVYAASAQLTVLTMLMLHSPLFVIWAAASVVNLRFVIFSAALKPYFRHLKLPQRMFYGYLNGDMNSMLFNYRYRNEVAAPVTAEQAGFFLGMAAINYSSWQIATWVGVALASMVPQAWGLELAASLTLLVLVIKGVEHWAGVVGCVVAGLTAVAFQFLPYKLWVIVAIVFGVAAALVVESVWPNAYLRHRGQPKDKTNVMTNQSTEEAV